MTLLRKCLKTVVHLTLQHCAKQIQRSRVIGTGSAMDFEMSILFCISLSVTKKKSQTSSQKILRIKLHDENLTNLPLVYNFADLLAVCTAIYHILIACACLPDHNTTKSLMVFKLLD